MKIILVLFAVLLLAHGAHAEPSLKGSKAAVGRAHNAATKVYRYTFAATAHRIGKLAEHGYVVEIEEDEYLKLHDVSYPFARPAVKLFLNRLSRQYYDTCGEKLVVTSLMRPKKKQPRNASSFSVHPTGMAVDLRIPQNAECRAWLENKTLLVLEKKGVIEATKERGPPHYHIVVYPKKYEAYVEEKLRLASNQTQ